MLFPGTTRFRLPRGTVGRSRKTGIATPSSTPTSHPQYLSILDDLAEHLLALRVEDLRAQRNPNLEVLAAAASPIRAFTMAAALGLVYRAKPEMEQRVHAAITP
jgi:hypothetical protein